MNLRRLLAMAYKEALQIWRDPRSLAIALIMPLMQMGLLGYGVSLDIKHVPLCVYDQENSQCSCRWNFDPPCRFNFDPGSKADCVAVGCG
ncbi:hypothetical protein THICB1_140010 [Thiomonas arsenitoxydans]|uniref:Uncharacterized protein n=1 Tax=Thiomonas arsenitoxydans (strain DSM 22701 / CIP 110005 / 3As) TaxID=426114 RepID=A0ABM9T343_THIA3|nr:hypothetical protein [Thiomonas arsenitoxydans]CQR29083.1 hypothetical protein THICB6_150012 [Thiomonas arsenitoxydans]CQR30126.1 hypothetical protein THICB1_140010 [Thiomonas arsenitoxydans]